LDALPSAFHVLLPMRIDILTLFPEICRAPLGESMMKRAQVAGALDLRIHNIRDWTTDKHRIVDDAPFGGGQGMVMKPEPIFVAVESLRNENSTVVLMTPQGRRFSQQVATEFSARQHLIIICGHYEGVDHRVAEHLVDVELSIGDYVLTNGAIAAVVVVDAVVRLLPGCWGRAVSGGRQLLARLLEGPQYTRPADFRGWKVPDVLLSGNHAEIAAWRERSAERTSRTGRFARVACRAPGSRVSTCSKFRAAARTPTAARALRGPARHVRWTQRTTGATRLPGSADAPEDDAAVDSAEAERVAQHVVQLRIAPFVRHHVEITGGIGIVAVQGRRNPPFVDRLTRKSPLRSRQSHRAGARYTASCR
jgi:tRNA (guanine37-N1)-methyltransferase